MNKVRSPLDSLGWIPEYFNQSGLALPWKKTAMLMGGVALVAFGLFAVSIQQYTLGLACIGLGVYTIRQGFINDQEKTTEALKDPSEKISNLSSVNTNYSNVPIAEPNNVTSEKSNSQLTLSNANNALVMSRLGYANALSVLSKNAEITSACPVDFIKLFLIEDIMRLITKLLGAKELGCMIRVTTTYHNLFNQSAHWKELCIADDIDLSSLEEENYKELYRREKPLSKFMKNSCHIYVHTGNNSFIISLNYKHPDIRGKHLIKLVKNKAKEKGLYPQWDLSYCVVKVYKGGLCVGPEDELKSLDNVARIYLRVIPPKI